MDKERRRELAVAAAKSLDGIGTLVERYTAEIVSDLISDIENLESKLGGAQEALVAIESIWWMAREYAEGGGSHSQEMDDFLSVSELLHKCVAQIPHKENGNK